MCRTFFAGTGLVDGQGASLPLLAIQGLDGGVRSFLGSHADEGETARPPGHFIHDKVNRVDGAVLRKQILEVIFDDVKGQISHV